MPYNRIQHLLRPVPKTIVRRDAKTAFAVVPEGVMPAGFQAWQFQLYAWARNDAEAALRPRGLQRQSRRK